MPRRPTKRDDELDPQHEPGKPAQVVKELLNVHYRIITLDMTVVRAPPVKQVLDYHYNELTVLASPVAFNIILNDVKNDRIPVAALQLIALNNFEIQRLWIENQVGVGDVVIFLAGRSTIKIKEDE